MIHQVRAALAQAVTTSGSTFSLSNGLTITGINSPLQQVLVTGRDLDGLNIGGTIRNPSGAEFIVMASAWHGDVCALTVLPKTVLA